MKIFGSITELISLVYRKNSQTITLKPSTAVTYTAARNVELPPQDSNAVIVSADSTQTLTNKTISGSSNTLTVLAASQLSGQVPTANGGTGQNSTATFPTSGTVTTDAGSTTLTNKTIDGSSNTLTVLAGTQLSGQVPTANGGTGVNSTATFPSSGTVTTDAGTSTLTNKTISGSSNTLTVLAASQLSGATPIGNGGTGQTTKAAGFDALSPATTKGDVVTYSTTGARLPVGTNGQVLSSDSAETTGLKWITVAGTSTATPTATGVTTSYFPIVQSSVNNVSADYTITTTDGYSAITVTTGSTDRTVTLPAASSNTGRMITIKKVDSGTGGLTIARAGSDTIDGATSVVIAGSGQGNGALNTQVAIISDGTNWKVLYENLHVALQVNGTGANATAGNILNFTSVQEDSHNAYSAGSYTVPFKGRYQCSMGMVAAAGTIEYGVYVNGTLLRKIAIADNTIGSAFGTISVSAASGAVITFRPVSGTSGAITAGSWITIHKIS